jgi:hypothetical protein
VLGNTQAGAHPWMRRIYDAKHPKVRYPAEKGHRKVDRQEVDIRDWSLPPGKGEKVV